MPRVFDGIADKYDRWFDTEPGRLIFHLEVECLRPFVDSAPRPRLEIGVGTGRFAQRLGIEHGVEPSANMLVRALKRGILVQQGVGEELPYQDESFGTVLMVVTLCFVDDPAKVLMEAARVLRIDGRLVVGLVPADSRWGTHYAKRAAQGDPVYSNARFLSVGDVVRLAEDAGLWLVGSRSCLFTPVSYTHLRAHET